MQQKSRLELYYELEEIMEREEKNKASYKLILPYTIIYNIRKSDGKKSTFTVNMNSYRQHGTCFFIMNKVKQLFHEHMKEQIDKIPELKTPIRCKYTVYKKDKRAFDINNVCAVADKFFMDALIEYGKLKDDNYEFYYGFSETKFGGIDKDNQRIEVEIYENVED